MSIRWGRYRKAIAIGLLGLAQVAAYIVADPRNLPPWVVTAAAAVNTLAVWWVRNDPSARSRRDLIDRLPPPTRAARPDERPRNVSNPMRDSRVGGYESGSRPASEMPPPSTGIKKPPTGLP